MTPTGRVLVIVGLTVYGLAVVFFTAFVVVTGSGEEGNALPALVLSAPWSFLIALPLSRLLGWQDIFQAAFVLFAASTVLGAVINGVLFLFVMRRSFRSQPRA